MMRVALVGYGTIAQGHAGAYRQHPVFEVVAVADPSPARRQAAVRALGVPVYCDLPDLLEREDVAAVDICAPPHGHFDLMRRALEAGLPVLCEKPFLQRHEFAALLDLLHPGDVAFPAHNYKYSPGVRLLTELVRSGSLGRLVDGHAETVRVGHARGVPEWHPHWRREPAFGHGGILQDHGPHSIYTTLALMGRPPLRVSCRRSQEQDHWWTTEDTARLVLDFGHLEFRIDLTWAGSERTTRYCLNGTTTSVAVRNDEVIRYGGGLYERFVLRSDFDDPTHASWFADVLTAFGRAITNPRLADEQLKEALSVAQIIEAAYESSDHKGRWIDLDGIGLRPQSAFPQTRQGGS